MSGEGGGQSAEIAARVQNHRGERVATNALRRENDCIEVVLAFPELIRAFEEWLSSRNLYLFPIPVEGDNLPAYGVGVVNFRQRTSPGQ